MGVNSSIEWTNNTWNPVRGCSRVSPGCGGANHEGGCYAEKIAARFSGPGQPFHGFAERTKHGGRWTGKVALVESALNLPLRWRKPRRIFVNSMSDLFHENLPDEAIDRVFAVMALAPQHTFQVLTKRAARMREYASDPETPGRVARAVDSITVDREIAEMGAERVAPIEGFPGYFVSDRGHIYTDQGSETCLRCGQPTPGGIARRKFCGSKCRQMDAYDRKAGKAPKIHERQSTRRQMLPMPGEEGHSRVMLYRNGETTRELIHRLVLTAFDRPPLEGEQGCHRNGDATINALPNLRWGTQSGNWNDRRRHGNGGPSDFSWPLPNVWKGTSVEDEARADERREHLRETPAAVRFVSYEPALGPIDWTGWEFLSWLISGGESGPKARPSHPDWHRAARDFCKTNGIAYHFKQWGEWQHLPEGDDPEMFPDDRLHFVPEAGNWMIRVGKAAAGRTLDGRIWNEFPERTAG